MPNNAATVQPASAAASAREMANAIRALAMDAVEKAKSGHPGMPMGMADVATVLFSRHLKFNPADPTWPDRDRFILSAGHGSMLIYSLLYLTGYADMTLDELKNFRQFGARTAGHPEYGHAAGIETTTGPLGQGLANSVGFALAERLLEAEYGALVNHHTYVIAGDGCLMEGISQEAISLAGHLKLGKLIVLFDDNGISIDGKISLSSSEDHLQRFKACGWDVQAIDGHDMEAVDAAITKAKATNTPSLIACKTTIAYGAPSKAGSSASHGSPLGAEEIAGTRKALGWNYGPFEIPDAVLTQWREVGKRSLGAYDAWQKQVAALPAPQKKEWERRQNGALPGNFKDALNAFKEKLVAEKPSWATRKSSGETLEALAGVVPELLGGSADLTGSNLTKAKAQKPVTPEDFSGRYVYYGIREHGMAAAMNGVALHGGFIPYGGTFLVFSDYCRPSIRLSALMQQRVVYVMTHDSIGLGEDGPTHQPVEHMAALRVIPNLLVFRPADAVETAECWQLAMEADSSPSLLALSRQNLPALRIAHEKENLSARGGYILQEAEGGAAKVVLCATGSEVSIAAEARKQLQAKGIPTRLVSVPSTTLLDKQPASYVKTLLPEGAVKVAVEAGLRQGWDRYIGSDGLFIGMEGFGASAPAEKLYEHFGITAEAIAQKVLAAL